MRYFDGILDMFTLWNKKDQDNYKEQIDSNAVSIAPPMNRDGAYEIESPEAYENFFSQQFFQTDDIRSVTQEQRINTYRNLMKFPEVENAVCKIIDDAIVNEDNEDVVKLDLSKTKFSDNIKNKINEEFKNILAIYDFDNAGSDLFRSWYVDSKIFFHKITNEKGVITELRQLDPRCLEFVRDLKTVVENGVKIIKGYNEYFVYKPKTIYRWNSKIYASNDRIIIPRSAVVYAYSGLLDDCDSVLGYLERAIRPANQLKLLEDAMVIYRITRAPERRIFYVDVGMMPPKVATQHMNSLAQSTKNRIVYDASNGSVKTNKNNLSMTEDYWMMRRDGKAVTEVTTLAGASGMNEMDDVRWFNRKLYEALRIPLSRFPSEDNSGVQFSGGADITRDELDFAKFVRSLQKRFSLVISEPLRDNLISTKIITSDDWDKEVNNINLVFHKDSYYTELKELEILERRANILTSLEPMVNKYISNDYVLKNVLRMSDEEIKKQADLIEQEKDVPRFNPEPENEGNF